MGLCKCPKKKVTNLFCFEHRVNVCEHCLVANHTKCIVQSYLQWLQDSDYSPNCSLCSNSLSDEACGECVRLTCYDVFHFACLNRYAEQLPSNTAPAGYVCPTCKAGIFPPSNMVSPVSDMLTDLLAKVNWARAGLGMPLVRLGNAKPRNSYRFRAEPDELDIKTLAWYSIYQIEEPDIISPPPVEEPAPTANHVPFTSSTQDLTPPTRVEARSTELVNLNTLGASPAVNTTRPSAQVSPYTSTPSRPAGSLQVHSVINVDEGTSARGVEKGFGLTDNNRKLFDSTKEDIFNMSHDHDDDKYKRRPAFDWLNRWLRSRDVNTKKGMRKDPATVRKKFLVVLVIGIIGFLTVIVIFSRLGRNATEDDPFLDPMGNPHIRVNDKSDNM